MVGQVYGQNVIVQGSAFVSMQDYVGTTEVVSTVYRTEKE